MMGKILLPTLAALGLMTVAQPSLAQASSAECRALAASISVRQQEAETLQLKRDTLAQETELSGEAWENAEAERNFGRAQAAAADETKAAYETLKSEFHRTQAALRAQVERLNGSVARYNQACTSTRG
jgi:uncharacterized protein YccT (UPF0319 family)